MLARVPLDMYPVCQGAACQGLRPVCRGWHSCCSCWQQVKAHHQFRTQCVAQLHMLATTADHCAQLLRNWTMFVVVTRMLGPHCRCHMSMIVSGWHD
jgi:hypothetical protein